MIKNFRARVMCDPRGKIKTGMKAKTSEGKEYPKSLDYFNLEKFKEVKEAYGQKPAALVIQFPSNDPVDFYDCNYESWGKSKEGEQGACIRRCDGETCLHRINESVGGKTYAAGEESPCVCQTLDETDKQKCKYTAYLKAWIILPQTGKIENPLCYIFETHSRNSGDAIQSALNDVRILTGGVLRGIPFSLSVKMVGGKTDAKQKFPIWTLIPLGTVSSMRESSDRFLRATPETTLLPLLSRAPGAVESPVMRDSRIIKERYAPQIPAVATVAKLGELKKQVNKEVEAGQLTQADYDELLDQMRARYDALTKTTTS